MPDPGGPPDPERLKEAIDAGAVPFWVAVVSNEWLISDVPAVSIDVATVEDIRAAEPAYPYLIVGGVRKALIEVYGAARLVAG